MQKVENQLAIVSHWIDGKSAEGKSTALANVTNPATGEVIAQVRLASTIDTDQAIAAASNAFPAWRDTSLARRTQVVFAFRELLSSRKQELAEIITREHGKVLSDALGEISRGQEVVEFACGIPHLLKGSFTENAASGIDAFSLHQPVGPVAVITPFNFPAMVPMWFFPLAIAAGNSVILKPSEKVPSAAIWMAKLWKEAGLPDGVFNVVHGDKVAVDALLANPAIRAVSFVGSTPVAKYVYQTAAKNSKRAQALGGAKNHMVVLPDADIDLAADAAINAAFGSAGERCMAVSVLIVVGSAADDLVARIELRAKKLVTGDGRGNSDMGPLITADHRDRVTNYVWAGAEAGATMVLDGRTVQAKGDPGGFWLGPTIFDHVTTDMAIYTDEIFGPVLSIVRADSLEDAIDQINANPYGNGAVIFTSDGAAARMFQNEVEVGMVGINVPIPAPMAYYSFGGWKNSLFGDAHAHGTHALNFYTRTKAVTSRWQGSSERSVNLGFPVNS